MKKVINNVLKVFAVGGAAMLLSAIAGGLAYLAIWLLCDIPTASGYIAVVWFALALLAAAAALAVVYMCGAWIVRTGRFSK